MIRKVRSQTLKDYVLFPALTGPLFPLTLAGNATANLIRNIWTFNIIFCGHFPAGVESFSIEETEEETRGGWYYRQLLGSANITGRKLFHTLTGNLSFQIEHHLFPDIPARRYPEIAAGGPGAVREVRPGLQHRSAAQAARLGGGEDHQAGAAAEEGQGASVPPRSRTPTPSAPAARPAVERVPEPELAGVGTLPADTPDAIRDDRARVSSCGPGSGHWLDAHRRPARPGRVRGQVER